MAMFALFKVARGNSLLDTDFSSHTEIRKLPNKCGRTKDARWAGNATQKWFATFKHGIFDLRNVTCDKVRTHAYTKFIEFDDDCLEPPLKDHNC